MDNEMFPENIEMSESDRTDNGWRIIRIHRVVSYAQALADLDRNENFYKKIKSIDDHKGVLSVTWLIDPNKIEKEYLQKAWDSVVSGNEGSDIEHEIVSIQA